MNMEEIAYNYCRQHRGKCSKITDYSFVYEPAKKNVDDKPKSTVFYLSYFTKIGENV